MGTAYWIWHDGDYELYHHREVSNRREEFDARVPCMWNVAQPHYNIRFHKTFTAAHDTVFRVVSHSYGRVHVAGGAFPFNTDIAVPAGTHEVLIAACDRDAFPAFFIDSEFLKTDGSWVSNPFSGNSRPVGYDEQFTRADQDPRVFPFCYEPLSPTATESVGNGILYDYGREVFGPVTVVGLADSRGAKLTYGESRAEALCYDDALIRETLIPTDAPKRPARAFRYLYIEGDVTPTAEYEYLPLVDRGAFTADDPLTDTLWQLCSHTFHLNSREAFFDGIKRDRWVWSGDAYQSVWVSQYLYFDPAIVERTIVSLLGRQPYEAHINTIADYTFYLFLMVYDHYIATGNAAFVRRIWDNLKALYAFTVERLDEHGYLVQREGDWIFIDWADMDKDGTLCAEQILLWQTHRVMGHLAVLCGEQDVYSAAADGLKAHILRDFWDDERGAFIDCYDSGKRQISRHPNIFAVLYDFVDRDKAARIRDNVLLNDAVPAITTPYFKLYELMALAQLGDIETVQTFIRSYWGGMVALGATSVWEQYLPNEQGEEHYAMYENRFGRSLCHAWGSGPILLWGKYICGVTPTSPAYATFDVRPQHGSYTRFDGTVPLPDGEVRVRFENGVYTVTASRDGGTLYVGECAYPLYAGVEVTAEP